MYGYVKTPEQLLKHSQDLFGLIQSEALNVRIHKEYPFTEEAAREAHRDLEKGKTSGKLIIRV
jgi:NADPH:quinone reductase-like Zn-dependent oxidoreductase